MVCLNQPYQFKYFKGCFPQILLVHSWIHVSNDQGVSQMLVWLALHTASDSERLGPVILTSYNNTQIYKLFTTSFLTLSWRFYMIGTSHCVKSNQIRRFFLSVFSCIRTECGKIWTRKNSVFGHFSRSAPSWKS